MATIINRDPSTGRNIGRDLTGHIFGRLTVLGRAGKNKFGYWTWECRCECGNVVTRASQVLVKGQTRSCGCLPPGRPSVYGSSIANSLFHTRRASAAKRGYEWTLTREEAYALFAGECAYCGVSPAQVYTLRQCKDTLIYNGLDRVDNTKGYTPENTVSCCGTCNTAKAGMSREAFLAWVSRVTKHLNL